MIGRLVRVYTATTLDTGVVQPFTVDFRNAIGWLEGRRWAISELGAFTAGNESSGFATLSYGPQQVATAFFPFGQLGYDSGGDPGFGFSRSAVLPLWLPLPPNWDGLLIGAPQLWLNGALFGGWSTNAAPIVWTAIRLLGDEPGC